MNKQINNTNGLPWTLHVPPIISKVYYSCMCFTSSVLFSISFSVYKKENFFRNYLHLEMHLLAVWKLAQRSKNQVRSSFQICKLVSDFLLKQANIGRSDFVNLWMMPLFLNYPILTNSEVCSDLAVESTQSEMATESREDAEDQTDLWKQLKDLAG